MSRRFKVTAQGRPWHGAEFEVEDGATEEDIREAAWEAVSELVSFGWEEIEEGESKRR